MTFLRQGGCLIRIELSLITIREKTIDIDDHSNRCKYIRIFLVFLEFGLHFARTGNAFGLQTIESVGVFSFEMTHRILLEQGKFTFEIGTLRQTQRRLCILTEGVHADG